MAEALNNHYTTSGQNKFSRPKIRKGQKNKKQGHEIDNNYMAYYVI